MSLAIQREGATMPKTARHTPNPQPPLRRYEWRVGCYPAVGGFHEALGGLTPPVRTNDPMAYVIALEGLQWPLPWEQVLEIYGHNV